MPKEELKDKKYLADWWDKQELKIFDAFDNKKDFTY